MTVFSLLEYRDGHRKKAPFSPECTFRKMAAQSPVAFIEHESRKKRSIKSHFLEMRSGVALKRSQYPLGCKSILFRFPLAHRLRSN